MPLGTGFSGFVPSIGVMVLAWLAMTGSALLLLEVTLWMGEGAHMISMSERILGLPGKVISWILYLFIAYASLIAYTAEGGAQVMSAVLAFSGVALGKGSACFVYALLFGLVIYLGAVVVERVNAIFFCGMVGAYLLLVGAGLSEVKVGLLGHKDWARAPLALPLMLTSFSFQTMVPSLPQLLARNARALRWSIVGGTSIAFVIYLLWQTIVLGVVSLAGIEMALREGVSATHFFHGEVTVKWVAIVAHFFAFFAIVTSFLGIAFGLYDFLSDGLRVKEKKMGALMLGALIVLPCWYFGAYFERIFIIALDTSGGFGDAILNGIMPVLMVWRGRYVLGLGDSSGRYTIGKVSLVLLGLFFASCLGVALLTQTGVVKSAYDL